MCLYINVDFNKFFKKGGELKNKLLVIGDVRGNAQSELFTKITNTYGNNFCYCSLTMCEGMELEKFDVIWVTKAALKNSSKIRRISKTTEVLILGKDLKLTKYQTTFSKNKQPKKTKK